MPVWQYSNAFKQYFNNELIYTPLCYRSQHKWYIITIVQFQ